MAKRTARRSPAPKAIKRKHVRQDVGWENPHSGHGTSRDRRMFTTYTPDVVRDTEAIRLWRSDDILANIVELLSEDATRRGITLSIPDDEGGKKLADKIMKELRRLDVMQKLKEVGQKQRALGGGALFPVLEGAVGDLDEPLDEESGYLDRIERVSAIHVLEPRELVAYDWYMDIRHEKFRKPSLYMLTPLAGARGVGTMMQMIHESRLIIFGGMKISNQLLPGQRPGWGDSIFNRVRMIAADFGLAWGSVATLLHEFATGVLNIDGLDELLTSKAGEQLVAKKLETIHMAISTLRARVLGSKDTYKREATPVAGYGELLVQLAQRVAAAARYPVTKLFGMSPGGMNATGEYDSSNWDDRVIDEQAEYDKPLEQIVTLCFRQITGPSEGVVPEMWSHEWKPLRQPTEKEISEQRKLDSEADLNWYNTGALTSDDIASHWKGDTYQREVQVDWAARKAQAKLDEQHQKQMDAAALAAIGRGIPANSAPKNGVPAAGQPQPPVPQPPNDQRQG